MMSTRPVVSYDDITLPYDQPDPAQKQPSASTSFSQPPPPKKRKKGNNHNQKKQHWDEPRRSNTNANNDAQNSQRAEFLRHANSSNARSQSQAAAPAQSHAHAPATEAVVIAEEEVWDEGEYEYDEEEEEEESRDLTHEEIWDDSALVDAWDSAMEEFRRYHGADTDWKTQPVKKSPLWYNVPVDPSKKAAQVAAAAAPSVESPENVKAVEDGEADSRPINFDTFVPTHDASLPVPVAAEVDYTAASLIAGATMTQDEAFERALSATYWAGYWTAMYHARRGQVTPGTEAPTTTKGVANITPADEEEDVMDEEDEEDCEDAGFVSTQR